MTEQHGAGERRRQAPWPVEPGYRLVSHTADVAIAARGRSREELFRLMAQGLFALIVEEGCIEPVQEHVVSLQAACDADLLHDWLQELNGLHQEHNQVFAGFDLRLQAGALHARVAGEAVDPQRHRIQHEIKGVTWHGLQLVQEADHWCAYVLVDV